ncbi:TonB-dependent receptor [Membranihabitans marinus]|uniref:TonB-dependent receptor n=1 Tax=Membranihabitans marinus TaxID=1227546 RepID=UPI001F37F870|nr:carboxypeptidase-like regulatory domain-containing protein [Membranihabitans marinus]
MTIDIRFLIFIFFPILMFGQNNQTDFTGEVRIQNSLDGLPYATIVLENSNGSYNAITDSIGKFVIKNIPFGIYQVHLSSIGYKMVKIPEYAIEHIDTKEVVFEMSPTTIPLEEVVIKAGNHGQPISTLSSIYVMTQEQVRRFPATFYDPARLATVYPGVLNDNDQANNLSIRGNSPNNMNYYIQGVEIVNPNHLANAGTATDRPTANGGGVSMISAQLLDESRIHTGVQPISIGQSTAGSLDYYFQSGSEDKMHFTGQAGLNGIDLALNGPLSDRLSYVANYRYSTVGLLSKLGVDFGGETINYQDLSLNLTFKQNQRTQWQFFAIGGDNSNLFEGQVDSLREVEKDLQTIDYNSKIGILGLSVNHQLKNGSNWHSTMVVSGRSDDRSDFYNDLPSRKSEDHSSLAKYGFDTKIEQSISPSWKWLYGGSMTLWSGNLDYSTETLSNLGNDASGGLIRPYSQIKYIKDYWTIGLSLGLQHNTSSQSTDIEPRIQILRYLDQNQKISLNSGIHHKQQTYLILLSSAANASLDMMSSWKSSIAYDFNLDKSHFNATLYYESLSDVAVDNNGFSALNQLEQYPSQELSTTGKGKNYGLEMSYNYYLNNGMFYRISTSLFDSKFKNPSFDDWKNTRYNTQFIFNAVIGKEFDWSDHEKNKTLGINLQLIYAGGYWTSLIDEEASRAAQTTKYVNGSEFTIQQPNVLRSYFRIYYKINHDKRYSMISMDLSNVLNKENLAYRYFDPFLDKTFDKYQLGLIPMLSYIISM